MAAFPDCAPCLRAAPEWHGDSITLAFRQCAWVDESHVWAPTRPTWHDARHVKPALGGFLFVDVRSIGD